jgi:hypothetical protein
MKNIDLEEKLTSAAQQALDELIEDYRTRILLGAKESASNLTGEIQEISVHDILNSVNKNQVKRPTKMSRKLEIILRLYTIIGLAIAIIGLFSFSFRHTFENLNSEQQTGIVIGISGLIFSIVSYIILRLRLVPILNQTSLQEIGDSRKTGYSMLFIKRWQDIELAARNLVASRFGESIAKAPVSLLIYKLRAENILSLDDEIKLREFLNLRNKILHDGLEIDVDQFEIAIKDVDKILAKIVSSS